MVEDSRRFKVVNSTLSKPHLVKIYGIGGLRLTFIFLCRTSPSINHAERSTDWPGRQAIVGKVDDAE